MRKITLIKIHPYQQHIRVEFVLKIPSAITADAVPK